MALDQRISLQKLEVLCLVFELGGVHQAAERLFVSQPVVSAHLHSLEARFGVPLFYRQSRRLALTEAGEAVHAWAQTVLNERVALERRISEIVEGVAGAVCIAASMTVGDYILPSVLVEFKKKNPHARITVRISDPEAALERVEQGDCQFGIIMSDAPVGPAVFMARQIRKERYVLIAAPDSDLPAAIPVRLLAELPSICPPTITAVRRLQDSALSEAGVLGRPVIMELGGGEAIKRAVAAGLGVALLSEAAVLSEIARGDLRKIEILDAELTHGLSYVQRRSTTLSPVQASLVDAICASSPLPVLESKPAPRVVGEAGSSHPVT